MDMGFSLGFARNVQSDKMKDYSAALPPIYKKYGGYYLALGGAGRGARPLTETWNDRAIMFAAFPSPQAVSGFWWSPEYRAAAKLREGAVEVDVCGLAGQTVKPGHKFFLITALSGAGHSLDALMPSQDDLARSGADILVSASGDEVEALEGNFADTSIVIVGFPDEAALTRFWDTWDEQLKKCADDSALSVAAYSAQKAGS